MRLAWDLGLKQEKPLYEVVEMFEKVNYQRSSMIIFVLVNWKITYETCLQKFDIIKSWGIRIDDCTWDTTKKNFIPLHWSVKDYKDFRKKCRKHNQLITFNGYDPEQKRS